MCIHNTFASQHHLMDHVEFSLAKGIDLTERLARFPIMELLYYHHDKVRNPITEVEPVVDMY
jgi:hypothetical protein